MANILLQSAENSSLLQTLNQSESKVIPSIYSTKEIYAPSATSWFNGLTPISSNVVAGGSLTWNLPKYGFLEQMLLSFTYDFTSTGNPAADVYQVIPNGAGYNLIDRIEFLSSSRVISTLYAQDLIALHSNLRTDQLYPIQRTFINGATGAVGDGAGAGKDVSRTFVLPIVFGFNNDINTVQNLSFNEPCQLRVVLGSTFAVSTQYTLAGDVKTFSAAPAGTASISSPTLGLRYKLYSEADNAMLLAENYSEPQLNQLTLRQYRENPKMVTAVGSKISADINLRNVDVINAFYVFVKAESVAQEDGAEDDINDLQEITSITLTASGQEICKIDAQSNYYSKITENGYSIVPYIVGSIGYENVFKVQTGLWENSGGGAWSNGWSARELNNLVLKVEANTIRATANYMVYVCETTSTILSTSSNTGRVVNSLVN